MPFAGYDSLSMDAVRRKAVAVLVGQPRRRSAAAPRRRVTAPAGDALLPRLQVPQTALKTVLFHTVATTVTLGVGYVFVQKAALAATLAGIWFVAGPAIYFGHESGWNYFTGPVGGIGGTGAPTVTLRLGPHRRVKLSRAVAKTATWRSITAVTDFTTSFLVTGNPVVAAGYTAASAVVGTGLYYGYEQLWQAYAVSRPEEWTAVAVAA
jgi:uncharacterized membrane protein